MGRTFTKIVATMGPASAKAEVLGKLIEVGVDVVRINFSHGTPEQWKTYVAAVRAAAGERPVAVLGDLCGPKIRVGEIEGGAMELREGATVTIRREAAVGKGGVFSTSYPGLIDDLAVGQRVLLDDGALELRVVDKGAGEVRCVVVRGGMLLNHKGVNLPGTAIKLPSVTEKDWRDLDFALTNDFDYVALSFVRSPEDLRQVRRYVEGKGASIGLVSKIEKPEAVANLAEVVEASDVVLVARGDLGVEMELTTVPVIQKQIVNAAHVAGKPVIVATQMLQSMIESGTPTRAEVSDVANAILDGADACMLSGETAVGKYPVEAAATLDRIAEQTEAYVAEAGVEWAPPKLLQKNHHRTAAIAHGARCVAEDVGAKMVVVWSQAGEAARYLSKNRLGVPVVGLSSDARAVRRMAMYYGVTPRRAEVPAHYDDLPALVDRLCAAEGLAEAGEKVVIVAGAPIGVAGVANSLSVHTVGAV